MSRPAAECRSRVRELAAAAAELGGVDGVISEPKVRDGWIGPGYGIPSQAGQDAARLVAVTEGVFLDPVYAAKAMAALIAECRAGRASGPQIFLVTGGAPTLFAGPLPSPVAGDRAAREAVRRPGPWQFVPAGPGAGE